MKSELDSQLREYGRQLDTLIVPLAADEIETQTSPAPPVRPRWQIALAAFAFVVIVVGGVGLLLFGDGGSEPVVDTAPPPTTIPAPDTSLAESDPPLPEVEGPLYVKARFISAGLDLFDESGGDVDHLERVEEVWYLDADTWRRETTYPQGDPQEGQDYLEVVSGEEQFWYWYDGNISDTAPYEEIDSWAPFDPRVEEELTFDCDESGCSRRADGDRWEECTVTAGVLVLGRPTTHSECSRVPEWDPTGREEISVHIDGDGRTLLGEYRSTTESGDVSTFTYEVLEIDTDPVFDSSTFEFECPTPDCSEILDEPVVPEEHPLVGQPAPEVAGDLVDAGSFDLADHGGQQVVFLMWATWCPPCYDDMSALETLAATREDILVITGVVLDQDESVFAYLADNPTSLPVIDLYTRNLERGSYLADEWGFFAVPQIVLIDENGVIAAVMPSDTTVDDLFDVIDRLGW